MSPRSYTRRGIVIWWIIPLTCKLITRRVHNNISYSSVHVFWCFNCKQYRRNFDNEIIQKFYYPYRCFWFAARVIYGGKLHPFRVSHVSPWVVDGAAVRGPKSKRLSHRTSEDGQTWVKRITESVKSAITKASSVRFFNRISRQTFGELA